MRTTRPLRPHGLFPALVVGLGLAPAGVRAAEDFAFAHEGVMGTSLEIHVRADGIGAARGAESRILREIDRLAAILSNHDASSEFRRWQAAGAGPVPVSPELFAVLEAADRWREASGGAFEPRVHLLTRLWSRCAEQGRRPTEAELAGARSRMASPAWRLDPSAGTAERLSDATLSLDAIAKGFIVERACEAATAGHPEVRGVVLNAGGDLRACGEAVGSVAVVAPWADADGATPLATIAVRDRAVATSGRSQRGFRIEGRRYSHILDPRSGLPARLTAGATVIAGRSADADALATALNVLGPEEGLRLVESTPGAACLIAAADGRVVRSAGWRAFEVAARAPKAETRGHWGDEFEVAIDFEINRPDTGGERYRRPFVAIWVEDGEGFPVRNLALWVVLTGSGPQEWLPDLKRWYRDELARRKVRKNDMVRLMARPTRPPGRYSVVWDGKDDQGEPVPPGTYTIWIEAAREHGTYQVIRHRLAVPAEPSSEELKGNVEIKSAVVSYRRKPAPE